MAKALARLTRCDSPPESFRAERPSRLLPLHLWNLAEAQAGFYVRADQRIKQKWLLKGQRDMTAQLGKGGASSNFLFLEKNPSPCWLQQPGQAQQQRGLARPIRTQDGQNLPPPDLKPRHIQNMRPTLGCGQVLYVSDGLHE